MSNGSQSSQVVPTQTEHRSVFVVVPAHNEGRTIETVVCELTDAYPNVVVVDDGSTDDTLAAARRVAPFVLHHLVNRGQGAAIQTGLEFALARGADYVVTFDADGQHRCEDIAVLIEPIRRGECDIVLGSRFLGDTSDIPRSRRWMLRLAVLFTRVFSRIRVTDAHNGLRAFSRKAAGRIHITMDGMAHASELADQIRASGLIYKEVPVRIRYTDYSLGKGQRTRSAVTVAARYLLGRIFP